MNPFTYVAEHTRYAWESSPTLRRCTKILNCPCLGCCYLSQKCKYPRKPEEQRLCTLNEINQRRRARPLEHRKRDPFLDRERRPWKWRRRIKDQAQSPLFAKLPAEIRLLVYEAMLCSREEVALCVSYGKKEDYYDMRAIIGCFVGMLRTCRRVYREAITMLHSKNTFTFNSFAALLAFSKCILPQRLALIRNFNVSSKAETVYGGDFDPDVRSRLFEGMPGTRELCVRHYFSRERYIGIEEAPRSHFVELKYFEKEPRVINCAVFYELITEDSEELEEVWQDSIDR